MGMINVLPFGKENRSYINDDFMNQCLRRTDKGLLEYIKELHFHPDHPENHNIRVTNLKMPAIQVAGRNGKWNYYSKNKVLRRILQNGSDALEHHYDNIKATKSMETVFANHRSFVRNIKNFVEKKLGNDDSCEKFFKGLMTETHILLFNGTRDTTA